MARKRKEPITNPLETNSIPNDPGTPATGTTGTGTTGNPGTPATFKPGNTGTKNPKPSIENMGKSTEGNEQTVDINVNHEISGVIPDIPFISDIAAASRKPSKTEAKQTAIVFMALLDGIAMMLAGESARMNPFEKELIQEPLARIIQRMDIGAMEVVSKWSDPLLLTMGLLAWLSRVSRVAREKYLSDNENDNPGNNPPPPPKRVPPVPGNGRVKTPVPEKIEDIDWKPDSRIFNSFRSERLDL